MKITDIKGTIELSNGVKMPYLGLGVWQSKNGEEVIKAVKAALNYGYRHIDTAAIYQNEAGVGQAIKESEVDREEVFVTSKVWNSDQGYDQTLKAFDVTMKKLDMDYLDLYLIHWPKPNSSETWRALEELYAEGRIKAIGVSNFLQHHLEDLLKTVNVKPMVNQLEFHPRLVQQSLLNYCEKEEIQYEAWSPLMQGKIFDMPEMKSLADKYSKTIAQVVLRWDLQKGVVTIPKSVRESRIIENADIFDFELSDEDIATIDQLDRHERVGPDPDNFDF